MELARPAVLAGCEERLRVQLEREIVKATSNRRFMVELGKQVAVAAFRNALQLPRRQTLHPPEEFCILPIVY